MARGACRGHDPEPWFPLTTAEARAGRGKAICVKSCEVRGDCLAFAMGNPQLAAAGVWGGLTEEERAAERRRLAKRAARAS